MRNQSAFWPTAVPGLRLTVMETESLKSTVIGPSDPFTLISGLGSNKAGIWPDSAAYTQFVFMQRLSIPS